MTDLKISIVPQTVIQAKVIPGIPGRDGVDGASGADGAQGPPGASGITDGDKGDVVVSGSGTAWTIDGGVVTYAKIQNVSATDKLLGRSTAGAGSVEEITCTSAGRALIDDTDATAQRTTLGLVIGTNVQAYDADLDTLATPGNWKVFYSNGSGNNVALTVGAAGTALAGNGVTAAPSWQSVLFPTGNSTLTGGFSVTSFSGGTITGSNQTYTPTDGANANIQHVTLNGSSLTGTLTWAAPGTTTQIIVEVLNGGSGAVAATLSTAGYTKVIGDTWVSTNGSKFLFVSTKTQNYSLLQIVALQ